MPALAYLTANTQRSGEGGLKFLRIGNRNNVIIALPATGFIAAPIPNQFSAHTNDLS